MKVLPPATPRVLATLDTLLDDNGIERRVIEGKLRVNPTRGPLSDADCGLIRHYAAALAMWIESQPAAEPEDEPTAPPEGCPACGQLDPDRHVFLASESVPLLCRCVDCGCTWDWLDGQVVLRSAKR